MSLRWLLESFADLALQTVFEGPFEQVRRHLSGSRESEGKMGKRLLENGASPKCCCVFG